MHPTATLDTFLTPPGTQYGATQGTEGKPAYLSGIPEEMKHMAVDRGSFDTAERMSPRRLHSCRPPITFLRSPAGPPAVPQTPRGTHRKSPQVPGRAAWPGRRSGRCV